MTGDPAAKRDDDLEEAKTPTPDPLLDDGAKRPRTRSTVRIPDDDVPGRPSDLPPPPVSRSGPAPSRSDGSMPDLPPFSAPPPPRAPSSPASSPPPPRPLASSVHPQDRNTVRLERRDLPTGDFVPPRPPSEPPPASGAAAHAIADEPLPGLLIDDEVPTGMFHAAAAPVAVLPPVADSVPPPPSEPSSPLLAMRTIGVGSLASAPPPPVAIESDEIEIDPPTPRSLKVPPAAGAFSGNDPGWTPAPADVLPLTSSAMEELGDEDLAEEAPTDPHRSAPPPPLRVTAPILADQVPTSGKTPPPPAVEAPGSRATVPDFPKPPGQASPPPGPESADVDVDVDIDNAPSITEFAEEIAVLPPPPKSVPAAKPPPPPSASPESKRGDKLGETAKSKKGRPWWEDLFDDDYLRSFKRPTDKQIKREATFIEERLGLAKGAAILDLACGDGRHAVALAERGYQVVGYDLSLGMLAEAADEANKANQKIGFVHGDMRDLNFDAQFDGIYCWGTSFGFFDEEKNAAVIKAIHKALRPGGVFLLDVMNRDYIAARQPNLVWFEGEGCVCMDEMAVDFITSRLRVKRTLMIEDGRTRELDYSLRLFSLHELGKMLHANGFRVVEVSGNCATPGVFFGADAPQCLVLAERD